MFGVSGQRPEGIEPGVRGIRLLEAQQIGGRQDLSAEERGLHLAVLIAEDPDQGKDLVMPDQQMIEPEQPRRTRRPTSCRC